MDALHPRTVNDIKFEQYLLQEYGMTRKEEIEKTFGGNIDALSRILTPVDILLPGSSLAKKAIKEGGEEAAEAAGKKLAQMAGKELLQEAGEGRTKELVYRTEEKLTGKAKEFIEKTVIKPFEEWLSWNGSLAVAAEGGRVQAQYMMKGTAKNAVKKEVAGEAVEKTGKEVAEGVAKSVEKIDVGNDSKLVKTASDISQKAKSGNLKRGKNYHGRLGSDLEKEILSNPDAVYVTNNNKQNLVYRKGENVLIVESKGSSKGNIITSYGPGGPRGESGAAIFGGSPSDPGMPVTHEDIINGIMQPGGTTFPPAIQIR